MAKMDFGENVDRVRLSDEEFNNLIERWRKILALPTEEFLSDKVQEELGTIHRSVSMHIRGL